MSVIIRDPERLQVIRARLREASLGYTKMDCQIYTSDVSYLFQEIGRLEEEIEKQRVLLRQEAP
jgi:hypothetical protein